MSSPSITKSFNLLKKIAEQDKELKDKVEKLEEARKLKEAEFHLMELAEKTTRVANQVKIQRFKVLSLR